MALAGRPLPLPVVPLAHRHGPAPTPRVHKVKPTKQVIVKVKSKHHERQAQRTAGAPLSNLAADAACAAAIALGPVGLD